MKDIFKLTLTLTLICLIAGALLAAVDSLTRERIAEANRARRLNALNAVLPEHDNKPDEDAITVTGDDGREWTFCTARLNGLFSGTAVESASPDGYGGEIRLMLGIGADGKTTGIAILAQKETPGLGANIDTPGFRNRLAGRDILNTQWKVGKDGGDIDHITAATISSRAVVNAVKAALDVFVANRTQIEGGN